jgi:polysaccharide biosynthesis protein PslH
MRTMNFVRYFQKQGDVDLLYLSRESRSQNITGTFRKEYCIQPGDRSDNDTRQNGNSSWRELKGKLRRLSERRPSLLTEWSSRATGEIVSLLTREQYDLIICRYIYDSYPFFQLPREIKKRVVIDFDDFNSDANLPTASRNRNGYSRKVKKMLERYFIINYQKRCLRFGAVLVCSKNDKNALNIYGKSKSMNAFVVPNTYPAGFLPKRPLEDDGYDRRKILLFVGTLNYGPNIKGLKWFLENIFSVIHSRHSDTKFLIAGRDPQPDFVSLCEKIAGVELHANVPDVGMFYERCGIVVVPVLTGGGTRIKILEAAMAGKPVFSTPFGAYGLEVTDGEDIMIFTDFEEFNERFRRINNKETYMKIKNNLKKLVEMNYSPEAFSEGMEKVMTQVCRFDTCT